MAQLGKALTILIAAERRHQEIDDDLKAFHAPCKCYRDAHRGYTKQLRQAQRHACHVAQVRNIKQLRQEFRRVLGNNAWPYKRYGYVPY